MIKGLDLIRYLESDYVTGVNILLNSRVRLNDDEAKKVKEILLKNKFVFDKETMILNKKHPLFFEASLVNDYIETFRQMKRYNIRQKKYTLEYFIENKLPISMLPSEIIYDDAFINRLMNPEEKVFFKRVLRRFGYFYEKKDEETLLKLLHSDASSIEEYIKLNKSKRRDELSLMEVYALGFYTKKLLAQNGLYFYGLNFFQYESRERARYGTHKTSEDRDEIIIYNGYGDATLETLVHTVHHEIAHAIQFSAIANESVKMDPDIDLYLEDKLLSDLMNDQYHEDNYNLFSYEFDADCKAYIMDKVLFGSLSKENEKIVNGYRKESGRFNLFGKRKLDGKYYRLDDLFLKVLNDDTWQGNVLREKFYDNTLLYLKFEKKRDGKFELVSTKKLKERCLATESKHERAVYLNLLKRKSKMAFLTYMDYINTLKYDELFENKKNNRK